jgi:hypothetical protein
MVMKALYGSISQLAIAAALGGVKLAALDQPDFEMSLVSMHILWQTPAYSDFQGPADFGAKPVGIWANCRGWLT